MPSSWREVIDFAPFVKPINRSLLEVGAIAKETSLVFVIDLVASASVRALNRAVAVISGLLGRQFISRTANRYLSVAANVIVSLSIST